MAPTSKVQEGPASDDAVVNPMELSPDDLPSWKTLEREATGCMRCTLRESRHKVAFGDGDTDAELMIVGDFPARHEDLQGTPFVGALGNLLGNTLADAGLSRDECYLTHVVKCHPGGDARPSAEEIETCLPYLVQQIALVRPRVILALGAFPTQVLLRRRVPIRKVAGYRLDVFDGVTLVPTHHPASALRGNPTAVAALRRDIRTAKGVLDGRLAPGSDVVAAARRQAER